MWEKKSMTQRYRMTSDFHGEEKKQNFYSYDIFCGCL